MENLTGGNPPVRPLPCVVPCKLYFGAIKTTRLYNFDLLYGSELQYYKS